MKNQISNTGKGVQSKLSQYSPVTAERGPKPSVFSLDTPSTVSYNNNNAGSYPFLKVTCSIVLVVGVVVS